MKGIILKRLGGRCCRDAEDTAKKFFQFGCNRTCKVICGCCSGKMQRKRGSDHADWHFFTCITKNRLGAGRCTGMYVREEDVFNAIYCQLKLYIDKHFISTPQYRQQIRQFNEQIEQATQHNYEANENFRLCYEGLVKGEKSIEDL